MYVYAYGPAFLHFFSSDYFGVGGWGGWRGGGVVLTSLDFVRHDLRSDRLLYFVFTHHVTLDTSSLLRCTYFHGTLDTSSLLRSHIMLRWIRLLYFVAHTFMLRWKRSRK